MFTLTQSGLKVCSGVDYTFSFARLLFFELGTCRLTVTLSGGQSLKATEDQSSLAF